MTTKTKTKKRTTKRTPAKKKKVLPRQEPPKDMIERAKLETAQHMGRLNTRRLIKPYAGHRPEAVARAIYLQYGIAAKVAEALGVHYATFNNWTKVHAWMRDAMVDAREAMLDLAESSLLSAVGKEEGWATCFLLKCRGKKRGYVEKLILGGSLDENITIKLGGADDESSAALDDAN